MTVRRDELLPYLEPFRRVRQTNRPLCCTIAVTAVAVAGLARWALEGALISGVPFITFFPAVIVIAVIGGVGPGLCAVILSVVAAKYFFIPPYFAFSFTWPDLVAVSLFTVIAAFDVLLIALLNETMERLARQEQNTRLVLDNSPAGMIAVDANGVITMVNSAVKKLFGYEDNELIGQHIELPVPARILHRVP
jgi:K+-sensing histidine kinase KdpD